MERKEFALQHFNNFIKFYNLNITLCFDMPHGFETAFGMFDITKNALYINTSNELSFIRFVYTFFHELRHALQYNNPSSFNENIQASLPYVVHFNGNCYMLKNNQWQHCQLNSNLFDFEQIYKSLPYELDANEFAYEQTKQYVTDQNSAELEKIYKNSLPTNQTQAHVLKHIYELIKQNTINNNNSF